MKVVQRWPRCRSRPDGWSGAGEDAGRVPRRPGHRRGTPDQIQLTTEYLRPTADAGARDIHSARPSGRRRSLRERASPPADDMQDKADDREDNQDVDRGGRNVEESESCDPRDTKNDSE